MPMSIVGRLNIGGTPNAAVMISPGIVMYRSGADIRKADFNAGTDVLVHTLMASIQEGNNVISGALINSIYCTEAQITYVPPGAAHYVVGVHSTTGIRRFIQVPPGATIISGSGIVRSLGTNPNARACVRNSDLGGNLDFSHIPPFPDAVGGTKNTVNGGVIFTNESYLNGHITLTPPNSRLGLWNGIDFSDNLLPLTFSSLVGGKVIGYCTQEDGFPWFAEQDVQYLYYFGINLTDRTVSYFRKRKVDNVTDENTNIGLTAGGGAGTRHADAFRLTEAFRRIHFSAYANVAGQQGRIYSSNNFPIDISDFLELDIGATGITGIWTDPPFVYATKLAGTNFGNQLIKIYDTALDTGRRARISGGEIWGIIPEIGRFLM